VRNSYVDIMKVVATEFQDKWSLYYKIIPWSRKFRTVA